MLKYGPVKSETPGETCTGESTSIESHRRRSLGSSLSHMLKYGPVKSETPGETCTGESTSIESHRRRSLGSSSSNMLKYGPVKSETTGIRKKSEGKENDIPGVLGTFGLLRTESKEEPQYFLPVVFEGNNGHLAISTNLLLDTACSLSTISLDMIKSLDITWAVNSLDKTDLKTHGKVIRSIGTVWLRLMTLSGFFFVHKFSVVDGNISNILGSDYFDSMNCIIDLNEDLPRISIREKIEAVHGVFPGISYSQVKINGRLFPCIVDTGLNVTVIPKNLMGTKRNQKFKVTILTNASRSAAVFWKIAQNLKVEVGDLDELRVDALVGGNIEVPILGTNVLRGTTLEYLHGNFYIHNSK
ncbi:uncharacterized protein LOC135207721 [Macrobrachium nipponense]|uniref:uncharacterized protein LOC135207721 n=1 Tax=Macrobrachium nipponense TaxID=159736 RepID=UPI0030C8BD28